MFLSSLKKIFGRGLALAIPLGVAVYVFLKILELFKKLIRPVAEKMGIERILGELTLTIFAVFLIILVIILLGLLMRFSVIAGFGKSIDEVMTKLVPSFNELKSMAVEKLNLETELNTWKPVLLFHKRKYLPAFIIEEQTDLVTFYVVMGTNIHDGELLITEKNEVAFTPITTEEIHHNSRQYGKGYLSLIKQSGLLSATTE
ncbi:MAG TPA: hypothetical protein VMI12_07125 [Puia sp.]|nr:hypothetical protein [Puia sp.]